MKWYQKFRIKRGTALMLAMVILCSTLLVYGINNWYRPQDAVTLELIQRSWNDALGLAEGLVPTGLTYEEGAAQISVVRTGWAKKWLNNEGKAKIGNVKIGDNGTETVEIDFSQFQNTYLSCMDGHTPAVGTRGGTQAYAQSVYYPTDNMETYPQFIRISSGGDINLAKFQLLLCAYTLSGVGDMSVAQLKDDNELSEYSALAFCVFRAHDEGAADGRASRGVSWEEDWSSMIRPGVNSMFYRFQEEYNPNRYGSTELWDALSSRGPEYYRKCWEAAKVASSFTYSATGAIQGISLPTGDPVLLEDGYYHMTYDYSLMDEATKEYCQKLTAKTTSGDWEFSNQDCKIDVKSPSGVLPEGQAPVTLELSGDVGDIAKNGFSASGLVAFRFYGIPFAATDLRDADFKGPQVHFGCFSKPMEISISPNKPGTPPAAASGFTVHVDRYKHQESWNANYNIRLNKFDSETGKPLKDAHFDILEAFDESQLRSTSLDLEGPGDYTSGTGSLNGTDWGDDAVDSNYSGDMGVNGSDSNLYNWGNDNGTQFTKWDGWDYGDGNPDGDSANDPCKNDDNVTNADGQLEYLNGAAVSSGELAHRDAKTYHYEKGYCGGHPAPEIQYQELTGEEEADEEIEKQNQQLHDAAWAAWLEEVEKCESMVEQGGFFHAIEEQAAQPVLEEDRDQFYLDFIQLTYDYSAVETSARKGYILHGLHTDDIPIEVKTVTSSEWKDLNGTYGGEVQHSGGGGAEEANAVVNPASDLEEELTVTRRKQPVKSATASEAEKETEVQVQKLSEEDLDDLERDLIITKEGAFFEDGGEAATSSDAKASPSEAGGYLESLFTEFQKFVISDESRPQMMLLMERDAGMLRNSIPLLTSIANKVALNEDSIVDHTFIVFDHRTEGEIHINKRDLYLNRHEDFDAYGISNGDGTLEGAIYGLYAADDIIHPDSETGAESKQDTGRVYQKDDLVAVAVTDRNGDASFFAFTEAPGMTYDYTEGTIKKRTDSVWDGPKNLHLEKAEADGLTEDNESYIGYDSRNEAQALVDSEPVDDTVYQKHSSNQDGLEGIDGSFATYPIFNNEDHNGNCWIGRPLIVNANGTPYYVKELSRAEGYELSVYGKANQDTNGKDSIKADQTMAQVQIGSLSYNPQMEAVYVTVTGTNLTGDVTLKGLQISEGAQFEASAVQKEEITYQVPVYETTKVPVPGKGFVYRDYKKVEAAVGDRVTFPNGSSYPVNKVSKPEIKTIGVLPENQYRLATPRVTTVGANLSTFMVQYNEALKKAGFREPDKDAPWRRVELTGDTDTDWITCIVKEMTEQDLLTFNRLRITDIVNESGHVFAVIRYDFAAQDTPAASIYSPETDTIYVKTATANGYFVYIPYKKNSDAVLLFDTNAAGDFVTRAILQKQKIIGLNVSYPDALPETYHLETEYTPSYWMYDEAASEQEIGNDGHLVEKEITTVHYEKRQGIKEGEVNEVLLSAFQDGVHTITIPKTLFETDGNVRIKISRASKTAVFSGYAIEQNGSLSYVPPTEETDSYLLPLTLSYSSQDVILENAGTVNSPGPVTERPIRQKIKLTKDIQVLPEAKQVWYCRNCGYENQMNAIACGYCDTERTTEEIKLIQYAHDTYSAVHAVNLSAGRKNGVYDTAKDWLFKLLGKEIEEEDAKTIPNFRFKTYLKSNLERLYQDPDGKIVWLDRNGNSMTPQYHDTNGDGNYDTFTWVYDTAYEGKEIDFPEKDNCSDTGILEASNVQKIYTKIEHKRDSMTTSAQANNVWDDYNTPQGGNTDNVGEKESFSTSQREKQDGSAGDLSGKAVDGNAALYSYNGKNENVSQSDRINENQNVSYTRLLETRQYPMEDGAGKIRQVEQYNYEKFFDAIAAANTDIWDNDMHTTYTGTSMGNYPGQHWFEAHYEKYQKDDADPDHTLENTDGADLDNTAGGDRDTSFKPFRWIREHMFGGRNDYETYPAGHGGTNTEVTTSTSDFARANAEASDAVRQFAVKWYLEDEAAKLVVNNGVDEDIAKDGGTIDYDEAVYDEALFRAIAKTYRYLRPFYENDLDTIYSVEWDSEANGGADGDYTTLSIDLSNQEEHYNISSYLPYGIYVVVEQQPERRDGSVNDWENRSYTIETPKEVMVPSVYNAPESNDTTDNYDMHYAYQYDRTAREQAKAENYLIRFTEEWAHNNPQDEREYVIRAHGYHGDYEIYKYGLDIDHLIGKITYAGGAYNYAGWKLAQDVFDPLKDYYNTAHRGKEGITEIATENGGDDDSDYMAVHRTDGMATANGSTYDGNPLQDRFFYGSVSEDAGMADDVVFKGGAADEENASGMYWKDGVRSMTGELTAYEGKYASMLVPWTVTAPADKNQYSSADFAGYADVNERDGFYVTKLRINKVDSETGEYILHDNAIFALYAGSRYNTFEEIEADAALIPDAGERAAFLAQFKPGDAKFYLKDTVIQGTKEFLTAMGATDITPAAKGKAGVESAAGPGELCSGLVKKGAPICVESERIMLTDEEGARTGQMTVYTTLNDVLVAGEENAADKAYANQNTGYFITPQPIGAGVYVLAEIKAPDGYARSKPVPFEVYSDKTTYYVDGDMYNKVAAVRYESTEK